ncbi:galectin-2 isoform X2 [Alligator sinensis]|nr:galectin-2 isoform X2 [Alligator sinensis]XP_025062684.1 galectin-2 isoform X2 [Alligator sinensis]XP_025062686.1 galectin-2 isoform X2 [Alligator sinensis]
MLCELVGIKGAINEKFEIVNLDVKPGEVLKVKGKIFDDTDRFEINIGKSSGDLGLHFNPRFDESVIVCNSRCSNNWQEEHREGHMPFSRGSEVKILIYFMGDKFQVKLPGGHELEFPNRHSYDKISYLSVKGGFRVTSFKQD